MISREQWRAFIDHPVVEWGIFALGILLMIAAIPVGALPGPGGVFVFAIGLAMVLKTSMWAKRRYVRFKRKQPKIGPQVDRITSCPEGGPTVLKEMQSENHDYRGEW